MKKPYILTLAFIAACSFGNAQKLYVDGHGVMTIDTVVNTTVIHDKAFNIIKKWAITNVQDYNGMVKGEVAPDLIKYLYITDYWAAMGTRQKYSQDVIVDVRDGSVKISLNNFRTYVPDKNTHPMQQAAKGWSGDKFFEDSNNQLKPKFKKFYTDVEAKFIVLVKEMTSGL